MILSRSLGAAFVVGLMACRTADAGSENLRAFADSVVGRKVPYECLNYDSFLSPQHSGVRDCRYRIGDSLVSVVSDSASGLPKQVLINWRPRAALGPLFDSIVLTIRTRIGTEGKSTPRDGGGRSIIWCRATPEVLLGMVPSENRIEWSFAIGAERICPHPGWWRRPDSIAFSSRLEGGRGSPN